MLRNRFFGFEMICGWSELLFMAGRLALQTFEEDLVQIEDRLLLSYEKRDLIVTDENKRRKRLQIFENLKSLKAALRKEIEFQFKCNFCDYRAKQLKHLTNHLLLHTKQKPFECKICKKKFSQKGNLNTHEKIHANDRRYKCQECGKKFVQKNGLVVHMRSHTGETPYECSVC